MTVLEESIATWAWIREASTDALGRAILAGDVLLTDRLWTLVCRCILHECALIESRPLT